MFALLLFLFFIFCRSNSRPCECNTHWQFDGLFGLVSSCLSLPWWYYFLHLFNLLMFVKLSSNRKKWLPFLCRFFSWYLYKYIIGSSWIKLVNLFSCWTVTALAWQYYYALTIFSLVLFWPKISLISARFLRRVFIINSLFNFFFESHVLPQRSVCF